MLFTSSVWWYYTVSKKTETTIQYVFTTRPLFACINCDLFCINLASFNKIPRRPTVYEIQTFKMIVARLIFSIWTLPRAAIWPTNRPTVFDQNGHLFHKHSPSIEYAIPWWLCQWRPETMLLLNKTVFHVFHVANSALVEVLLPGPDFKALRGPWP